MAKTHQDEPDIYDKEREATVPNEDSGGLSDDERSSQDDLGDSGYYNDSDEEQSDAHDDVANKETDGSGPKKDEKGKGKGKDDKEERDPNLLYKEGDFDDKKDGKKGLFGRKKKGGGLRGLMKNRRRALAIAGFGSMAALGITVMGSIFMPGFELLHIKEIMVREYGGIQSQVIRTRSGRIYSRGFFFHEGQFDGYKSRGKLTSIYKNVQSDKFVADMRANGYDFKVNQSNGRLTQLIGPGGVERINTATEFESMWKRKSAIKDLISERHPDRTKFWRNRKARAMFRRYGLVRKNWLRDNRVVDWLEKKELAARERIGRNFNFRERFKAKLRGTLMGLIPGYESITKGKGVVQPDEGDIDNPNEDEIKGDADVEQSVKELGEANELADEITAQVDADPSAKIVGKAGEEALESAERSATDIAGKTIAEGAAGAAKGAAVGFAAVADYGCQAYSFAQAVRGTSRVMRALQLAKFATAIFVMADSVKDGDIDSKDMAGFMALAHTYNRSSGKSFYSSGSWNYVSTGRKNPAVVGKESTRYSVDGKAGGNLGSFLDAVDHYLPTKGVCRVAGNPLFQVAAGATELIVVRIGGGLVSGGTITATSIAASAAAAGAIQATLEIAKVVLLPILARTLAGAVITGDESGDNLAAAMVAGAGTLSQMRGHNMGMKPLKNSQVAELQLDVDDTRRTELAQQSIFERYISLDNPTSLASTSLVAGFGKLASVSSIGNLSFTSIPSLLGSVLDVSTNRAFAAEDPEEIAHDAFGNPIMGLPDSLTTTIDPGENEQWMLDRNLVNEEGVPVPGSEFEKFKQSCIDPVDVEYNTSSGTGDFGRRDECFDNSEIKNRMRLYVMDLDISLTISDNVTGAFKDSDDPASTSVTPVTQPTTGVKKVHMIGDSLTVGYNLADISGQFLANGWTATINAIGGKDLRWGIEQIEANRTQIAQSGVLVIALGTNPNESPDLWNTKLIEAIDKVRAINPSIQIYWANIYSTRPDALQSSYDAYNNILKLQSVAKNFILIDLKSKFDDGTLKREDCFGAFDSIHPYNCYKALSLYIVGAVVNGRFP